MIITEDTLMCSHLHSGHSCLRESFNMCWLFLYNSQTFKTTLYVSLITLKAKNKIISLDDYPKIIKKKQLLIASYLKLKQLIFPIFPSYIRVNRATLNDWSLHTIKYILLSCVKFFGPVWANTLKSHVNPEQTHMWDFVRDTTNRDESIKAFWQKPI